MRKKTATCYLLLALFLMASPGFSQDITATLEGYWQGGFLKGNSLQPLEIRFSQEKGQLQSLQIIEEWHPNYGEFVRPVELDSLGHILLRTGYGPAKLRLDTNNLELIGQIEGRLPVIYLHLKKKPAPPAPAWSIEPVSIPGEGVVLNGHLHLPRHNPTRTAVILVSGRSCYAGETQYDLMAKVLREYGIAVLAYQKRGTGKSTGDCQKATIEDLAADVRACHAFLQKQQGGFEKIGVLGSSAGGWVMVKAQEKVDFDFMISVVGPGTSVYDQQMQSMTYGMAEYELAEESREGLIEYTRMMFEAPATQQQFDRFQALLEEAKRFGWDELLDDTDIPPSVAGIDSLWVRRHAYDPETVLQTYAHPFLALYGQRDWIVPYKENITRLENCFSGSRRALLTTHIAYDGSHGMATQSRYVDLNRNQSYWHFFRISPQLLIEIVNFLRAHHFIE